MSNLIFKAICLIAIFLLCVSNIILAYDTLDDLSDDGSLEYSQADYQADMAWLDRVNHPHSGMRFNPIAAVFASYAPGYSEIRVRAYLPQSRPDRSWVCLVIQDRGPPQPMSLDNYACPRPSASNPQAVAKSNTQFNLCVHTRPSACARFYPPIQIDLDLTPVLFASDHPVQVSAPVALPTILTFSQDEAIVHTKNEHSMSMPLDEIQTAVTHSAADPRPP